MAPTSSVAVPLAVSTPATACFAKPPTSAGAADTAIWPTPPSCAMTVSLVSGAVAAKAPAPPPAGATWPDRVAMISDGPLT